ncbi:MAG: hypothetical protein U9N73_04655 [Candidatus Auribacterota bacterium]|nr:hypothetical protein [Candidatus Auribacterota bacterium]
MIYHDEIIDEVWKIRDAYAEKYHHNLHEIVADLQERQKNPFSTVIDRRTEQEQRH